jgi:DNA-binding MarR family transcriptional regulator
MRKNDLTARFRHAYWSVVRELDTERLRQWERSHLTLPQLRVLFQVRRTPGITTGELARMLGITVSTTSGLVIKLTDRSLIRRGSSPDDRRQAPLYLTDEATAVVGEISDAWRPFQLRVAAELGDDLEQVTAALERLAAAAAASRLDDEVPPGRQAEPPLAEARR